MFSGKYWSFGRPNCDRNRNYSGLKRDFNLSNFYYIHKLLEKLLFTDINICYQNLLNVRVV